LREARAAASVRHPNVASVFHLGRTGENFFYAMEFVEGETLETLIQRSGRLEMKLALEITTQVAAGLAAVPLERLKGLPQPVVVLLELLLKKDSARRFQSPTELLKVMPTVRDAIGAGRRVIWVVTAGDDHTARVWEAAPGKAAS
jgi:serine/threonine protein kinase